VLTSFPPIVGPDARVLVLGSMPGVRSLEAGRYYAHPRNRFWNVMGGLIGLDDAAPYEARIAMLQANRIALWDVLKHCEREGSLDTRIVAATELPNDFATFFSDHRSIEAVAFNGAKAAAAFRKLAAGQLGADATRLALFPCPSTSPANASKSLADLIEAWGVILPYLDSVP
jgi:double-stranded uracil-DNA glycosylase